MRKIKKEINGGLTEHVKAETLLKMEHHQKINHFTGIAKNLMRMWKKSPADYNFF